MIFITISDIGVKTRAFYLVSIFTLCFNPVILHNDTVQIFDLYLNTLRDFSDFLLHQMQLMKDLRVER